LNNGENDMFGKSETITVILGVSPAASTQHVIMPTGSLLIRWRSGRRAEEVYILRDAALALVAAIEEQYGESRVPHGITPPASELSARAPS
jgi:hypothetical protein